MAKDSKDLKRLVRERMARSGERYSTARTHLIAADLAAFGEPDGLVAADVGAAVRAHRERRRLSLDVAAARVGVSRLKLDLVERGLSSVGTQLAEHLCRDLDLPPSTARAVRTWSAAAATADGPDRSRLPQLAVAAGFRLTAKGPPTARTWIDWFCVDGLEIYVVEYVTSLEWLASIERDPRVEVQVEGEPPVAGDARVLPAGPERERASALLASAFPADADWLADASLVRIRVALTPGHDS